MLELPHTLIGALVATKIPSPYLALPLSLGSHFLVDAIIPHWNPSIYRETKEFGKPTKKTTTIIIVDVVLSLVSGFYLASRFLPDINRFLVVILCCLLAVLPDVVEAPYFYLKFQPKFLEKLVSFQRHHQKRAKIGLGLTSQILIIGICYYLALSK